MDQLQCRREAAQSADARRTSRRHRRLGERRRRARGRLTDGSSSLATDADSGSWRPPAARRDRSRRSIRVGKSSIIGIRKRCPDGNAVIYTSYATPIARARIEAFDLKTNQKKVLVEGAVFGRYSAGHLLYMRDGAIFAVEFDPKALRVIGTPVPVQDDVSWVATDGLGAYAIAANGTLAYLKASEWNVKQRVVWADRTGREQPALPAPGVFAEPRLSPNGRWIVVTVTDPRRELWLFEIGRGVLTPLSRTDNAAFNAIWTPDSKSVVYAHENPVYDLHRIPIDGSSPDEPVISSRWDKYASGISPDGRSIVYVENNNSDRLFIAPTRRHRGAESADRERHGRAQCVVLADRRVDRVRGVDARPAEHLPRCRRRFRRSPTDLGRGRRAAAMDERRNGDRVSARQRGDGGSGHTQHRRRWQTHGTVSKGPARPARRRPHDGV